MQAHQVIDADDFRSVYFVGDLHGDWKLFNWALKQLKFSYRDVIISVGDLIDRGDNHIDCLSFFLHTPNAYAVRGNHEDMMIKALVEGDRQWHLCWYQNGGFWCEDYPAPYMDALAKEIAEKFPIAITVKRDNLKIGVCHAECPMPRWEDYITIAGKNARLDSKALWERDKIKKEKGIPIVGVDMTIHGHSVRTHPINKANQHWIDTGSVFDTGDGKYGLTISELKDDGTLEHHRFVRDCFESNGFRMV